MAYCHVAHDCVVGDYFIAANAVNLAGHVTIGRHVTIGGITAIVQFRTIGEYSYIGAFSLIVKDVVPYAMLGSGPVRIAGINRIGLQRNGFDDARRTDIKRAYRILFRQNLPVADAVAKLRETYPDNEDIRSIVDSVLNSKYGILRMKGKEDPEE
jgi:UDP-N-acetylglucosamine acyltransferase